MNIEELNALKEYLLKIQRESFNWVITQEFSSSIQNAILAIDQKILTLKYTPDLSKEEWDALNHKFNKLMIFSNGDLEPEFIEFDLSKLENKVKELNEKNIKDADKIAIFSNGESKKVGRFKRLI